MMTDLIQDLFAKQCEQNWLSWKRKVLSITATFENQAPGLSDRIERFTQEHKVSFYKGFREKLDRKITDLAREALAQISRPASIPAEKFDGSIYEHMDRIKLEAYLTSGKDVTKAAKSIGMTRTALSMWVSKNQEMIFAEERKS